MMEVDPDLRYDIKQVLKHPFLTIKRNSKSLDIALKKLKTYNQRLKLKASQIAIYWMNIMQKKKNA
jgi:hypothetical protein